MSKLTDLVSEAYVKAEEEGNDLDSMTSREVADEMQGCNGNLEKFHILDIAYAVIQYRKRTYGKWSC